MTTRIRSRWTTCLVVALALLGLATEEVAAVIGRPLTPVSYAGVARRTARRTTYAAAATAPYYGGGGYVSTIPAGCTTVVTAGVSYRSCGGTMYRPYYNGTTVVYHVQ
jgi:hypothetical protein